MRSMFFTLSISLLGYINVSGQQHLNLDFEKKSIDGINRPWGWAIVGAPGKRVLLDSVVKHHGKYSIKMFADSVKPNLDIHQLKFDIEPFEFKNKFITVDGWVRTYKLEGEAFFTLNYSVKAQPVLVQPNLESEKTGNTTDWKHIRVKMYVPDSARILNLSIHQKGKGITWFDNFRLAVNEKALDQVEVQKPFTVSQVNWIDKSSFNINTVDASRPSNAPLTRDLVSFKKLVGDAQIIALGESTHGTSEFFRLKHRVLEYLVNQLGVRVFAIEDNQLVVERVNKFVLGGAGTARSSMHGMFSVWQNEEVHNMIDWIRHYNDNHSEDKVQFVGFDVQNLALPLDSLLAFAKHYLKHSFSKIDSLLADLRHNGSKSYMVSDSTKYLWFVNSLEVFDIISGQKEIWLSSVSNKADSTKIYWGVQYANLVKQYAEMTYRGHLSFYRDLAMAENISWILSLCKPATKMLVWAHDYHISKGEHPDSNLNIYYGKSMGHHLSKKIWS